MTQEYTVSIQSFCKPSTVAGTVVVPALGSLHARYLVPVGLAPLVAAGIYGILGQSRF